MQAERTATHNLLTLVGTEIQGLNKPLTLPWLYINDLIGGGLRRGQVTCLAGAVGSGKTYFALELCSEFIQTDIPWQYQPLEDNRLYALRRLLAIKTNDWKIMSEKNSSNTWKIIIDNKHWLQSEEQNISENPAIIENNLTTSLDYRRALATLKIAVKYSRLYIIDPISMLDFSTDNRAEWQAQQDFIKKVVGIVSGTNCHVILVCHLRKMKSSDGVDIGSIEGSTAISRFCHNVLLLNRHKEKNQIVNSFGRGDHAVNFKRTMCIGKTRNGSGTGLNLAMDFVNSPRLIEHGLFV